MNKYLKKVMSAAVGISLFATAAPYTAQYAAFAAESGTETGTVTLNPIVVQYSVMNTNNKSISTIYKNTTFNAKIVIKDIKVKTSSVASADNIDFIKSMDSFKGTVESVNILSQGDELLRYEVNLKDCKWTGTDNSFGFMVGYAGGEYATGAVNISECTVASNDDDTPVTVAEPMIKITADDPDTPIRAGESGEIKIRLKNLGSTSALHVLAEITPSDDIIITGGTGSQDLESLGFKDEKVLTVKYKALDKISSLKQNFGVTLKYYYDNGTTEVSGSSSATVSVAAEISTVEKVYPVIMTEYSLAEKELDGGKEYSGTVTIKNIGSADMKGLFVKFTGSDDIVVTDGTGSGYFESIPMGSQKTVTVKFRTMDKFANVRQQLTMNLKYTYTVGSDDVEGSYDENFIMFGKIESEESPLPVITSQPLDKPLEAGKQYRKAFYIVNKGAADMQNISVRIKGSDGITITGGTDHFFVDKLKAGAQKRFLVSFDTNADMTAMSQILDIEYEYSYDKAGTLTTETKTGQVTMNSEVSSAPVLRISGEKQESALVADTEYDYNVLVKNYGDITVRDVFVDFTGTDAFYFLDGTESGYIEMIRPGDTVAVPVRIKTLQDITAAKQGITAAMKYSYGRNSSIKQAEGSSSLVLIAAPNKDPEETKDTTAAPNIIIGRYDIGADQIAAGDVFTLDLDFYNTSASTNVENMVMTISASGDLSIYGGSSSFYYSSLAAAASGSESVKLRALPTATTGTSSLTVSFKYDYVVKDTRTTLTSEQTIFVPLYQPDKMTFSVSKPTYDIYVGNEVYLTLSYMNKGRSDAANVKVELVSQSSSNGEGEVTDPNAGMNTFGTGEAADGIPSAIATGEAAGTLAAGNEAAMMMYDIAVDAPGGMDGAMGTAGYDDGYGMDDGMSYDDPGFTALSTEKVLGNIVAGGNGTADFIVTPTRQGEVTVVFKITYEDSNMNEIVKELPVTLNVIEQDWVMPDYPMTMEAPDEEQEGGFPWLWVIIGGAAAVVIAVVIIIIVNVRKKKKGKKFTADDIDWEDDLDENDDKTTKV